MKRLQKSVCFWQNSSGFKGEVYENSRRKNYNERRSLFPSSRLRLLQPTKTRRPTGLHKTTITKTSHSIEASPSGSSCCPLPRRSNGWGLNSPLGARGRHMPCGVPVPGTWVSAFLWLFLHKKTKVFQSELETHVLKMETLQGICLPRTPRGLFNPQPFDRPGNKQQLDPEGLA